MRIDTLNGTTSTYHSYRPQKENDIRDTLPETESNNSMTDDEMEERIASLPRNDIVIPRVVLRKDVVNPEMIDPTACSFTELERLLSKLSDNARYKDVDFTLPPEIRKYEGDMEKHDYCALISGWLTEQAYRGNMLGYHSVNEMRAVLADARDEAQGGVEYFNGKRVYYSPGAAGALPFFDTFSFMESGVERTYNLQYAKESTIDDPIIEIFQYDKNENVFGNKKIHVNEANPRNATVEEMFALCSHRDLQSVVAKHTDWNNPPMIDWGKSTFYYMFENKFFNTASTEDFSGKKLDWMEPGIKSGSVNQQVQDKILSVLQEMLDHYIEQLKASELKAQERLETLFREDKHKW